MNGFDLESLLQLDPITFSMVAVYVRILRLVLLYVLVLLLVRVFRSAINHYKIQAHHVKAKTLGRELLLSLSSFICFIPSYFLFVFFAQKGYYPLYSSCNAYGAIYFVLSIFILLFAHETYHYWYHRFMHTNPWVFRNVHRVHHQSHSPTILSAYAFHPLEALFHPLIFILVPFCLPLNIFAIFISMTIAELFNIFGHVGYECYPKKIATLPILKYLNRATFHDMHHERGGRKNYGYYTTFWDQWMGTHYEDCEAHFAAVIAKREEGRALVTTTKLVRQLFRP